MKVRIIKKEINGEFCLEFEYLTKRESLFIN